MTAVIVSVLLMIILSMLRVNVVLSILLAALSAGLISGLSILDSTNMLISGMSGQAETALSIVLLGIFAVMIKYSGITGILVTKLLKFMKGKRGGILLTIAGISCFSQNLVPVHIAFIPILIPPLLHLFDSMKIDRRGVATALTFGLKAPYIMIPAGYGLMFHQIIATEMKTNGMKIAVSQLPLALFIPGLGMIAGLLIAVFITYRKEKVTSTTEEVESPIVTSEISVTAENISFNKQHVVTLMAIILALIIQVVTHSLALGALAGIILMFAGRVVPILKGDEIVDDGMKMMGAIAFVMLIAAGYATILKETGAITELVTLTNGFIGDSKPLAAFTILMVGLLVTMGIGSSFGTIPILASVYVPLCLAVGFSPLATASLIGTASALGDAGSPASDSTIGPTMGLNADGKHNHIWDTCVPTFMHYNIPLFIFGMIAALVL
ncbi:Na+/H+ antiporter family protein [Pseudobacillus wudalianchiensis]|uniref:Sodium:proton antiporter n=1 Tax=Pseudobacillus wudalianchiensis TaxID=1743143 RepID=A0A1B9AE11_9BACI|nr:Na+/H+ antiporter NhaC family protein [Bacillus wudalianchiensis]OCA82068.1 sodium:proton antiporter [Bacillus wudalianchiensis]